MPMNPARYAQVEGKAKEVQEGLSVLVGQKLIGARVFLDATWHFYFGPRDCLPADQSDKTYLGVECPWRIHNHDAIMIGSEDYDLLEKSTDRQMKILQALIGDSGLLVESVEADAIGGFRIGLAGAFIFDLFPASDREMEWIFCDVSSQSLILMKGVLHKSKPK